MYFCLTLVLLSFFGCLLTSEQFNAYNNGVYLQNYADVIADAGAEYGNDTNGHLDPVKVAEMKRELSERNNRVNQDVRISIDSVALADPLAPTVKVYAEASIPWLFPTVHAEKNLIVERTASTTLLPDLYEGIIDMNRFPAQQWRPIDPIITSDETDRSAENYNAVIDQLWVEKNQRYADKANVTWCNIFMWDVTKAMGAEIPYYVNNITGEAEQYRQGIFEVAHQQSAKDYFYWLRKHGADYGWRKVSAAEGQSAANRGRPAVVLYRSGHCQVIRPFREDGSHNSGRDICYAQAGSPKAYGYQSQMFTDLLGEVWIHG